MAGFSERHGIQTPDAPITIRYEAPDNFREAVIAFAYRVGHSANGLRDLLCDMLGAFPDRNNWSEPNVASEVETRICDAPWNSVYDFAEEIYNDDSRNFRLEQANRYQSDLNKFFRQHGFGWQMINGQIEFRGEADVELNLLRAVSHAEEQGLTTIPRAFLLARAALSSRPNPNTRDAINNSVGALEAAARHVSGDASSTLGDLVKFQPNLFPGALRRMVEGLWGFASEEARHVSEGREPRLEDAELLVGIAASITTYVLSRGTKPR